MEEEEEEEEDDPWAASRYEEATVYWTIPIQIAPPTATDILKLDYWVVLRKGQGEGRSPPQSLFDFLQEEWICREDDPRLDDPPDDCWAPRLYRISRNPPPELLFDLESHLATPLPPLPPNGRYSVRSLRLVSDPPRLHGFVPKTGPVLVHNEPDFA